MVIIALVFGVVVDAIHRLGGYEDAYGLTMLRLYCTVFAVWIAVVFVVVGVAYSSGYRGRRWLTSTIGLTAFAALLIMNIVNPEAAVARRNLDRPTGVGETDIVYLTAVLGDDAVPAIIERLGSLDAVRRSEIVASLCAERSSDTDLLGWNHSQRTAVSALAGLCAAPRS